MKLKKLYKYLILIFIIAAFTTFSIIQYKKVNARIPNPSIEEYEIKSKIDYDGFEISVQSFKFVAFSELEEEVKDHDDSIGGREGKLALVELKVRNNNKDTKTLMLDGSIQSKAYSNNINIDLFYYYNDKGLELESGEEHTYIFPYTIFKFNFTDNTWDKLTHRKFEFIISLYPVKRVVNLS